MTDAATADITTKPLTPADLDAVIAIDGRISGNTRRGYFEKRLAAATECPQDYVFVGVHAGDKLAGFAFAKLLAGEFGTEGASASLDSIAVDPSLGITGLGQKLLAAVEAVLSKKKVTRLDSQIDWAQVRMLDFMARNGFGMAPKVVLIRSTDVIAPNLAEDEDDPEMDFSDSESDAANALSRDRVPVRSMEKTDLGRIVKMDAATTGVERTDYYARKLREMMQQSGVRVSLVAEQDDHPVGFIMARVDYGEFGRTTAEAVLDTIGVDPGYRDMGVGQVLMARLMSNLNALGVDRVRSEVSWNDTGLINYFAAAGFTPAQRVSLTKTL
jgi:ribosomal protein S18 acetylase RimI-like enzyme